MSSTPGPAPVAPRPAPPGSLNVRDFGAKGDGIADDQAALQRAIAAAKAQGKTLYVPPGQYKHSNIVELDGVKMVGAGPGTNFIASNWERSAFVLTGSGGEISGCRFESPHVEKRVHVPWAGGIWVRGATNFKISDNIIDGAGNSGIIAAAGTSSHGEVNNNVVKNTRSDAIHFTDGSHDLMVRNNHASGSGDDMIAVVSYKDQDRPCERIQILDNKVNDNHWGRGITVVGGKDVLIQGNSISGSSAAGLYFFAEDSYNTYGISNVTARNNTITNAVNRDIWHGAVHIGGRASDSVDNIVLDGNTITGSRNDAITVANGYARNVTLTNNTINGAGGMGVRNLGGQNVTLSNNRISGTKAGSVSGA